MQQANARPLQHYNDLINCLNPWGRYQIRLLIIMVSYWLLSGLTEAGFELTLARQFSTTLFFLLKGLQIVVVMLVVVLSLRFARTHVNTVLIIIVLLGSVVLALGVFLESYPLTIAGQFSIVLLHYPMSLNLVSIMLEYVQAKHYPVIWVLGLGGFTLGKLLAVWLAQARLTEVQWTVSVVLPCLCLYLLSTLVVEESLRFWIDQDFNKAQKLLHQIAETNRLKYEPIEQLLQRQFFWHKVTLTKYNLCSLLNYKSISLNTYVLVVDALLLGIICRCPDFIQHLREGTSFEVDDSLEVAWVSAFQLIALLPAYLASSIMKRKTVVMSSSIVLVLLSCFLALLELEKSYYGRGVLYSMTIFGLSSFFSIVFFYFLVLGALEYYPHTVRTVGCGAIFSLYKLGMVLFSAHIQAIEIPLRRNEGMMQLVVCCSCCLVLHSLLLEQTSGQQGRYDLPEIQEKEYDQYLPI